MAPIRRSLPPRRPPLLPAAHLKPAEDRLWSAVPSTRRGSDHVLLPLWDDHRVRAQTRPSSAGSGSGIVGVHSTLYGLDPNTVYHYQLVAQNAGGTSAGVDQTFTTTSSEAAVLGHEGFVSPGGVVGVELGWFHGTTDCRGHVMMTANGTVIGQRDYSIAADSGGFQNMKLTPTGEHMLGSNGVWHLLPVSVTATSSTGQKLSYTIDLARWVWH
jgi:hypothetical protein